MKANTAVFTAADGTVQALPLDALIERGAVIASKVNGEDIAASMGGTNQLWIPGIPGKYFIRNIVAIDFEQRDEPPAFEEFEERGMEYGNRPNVSAKGPSRCRLGESISFEGYADDFDRRIVAVQCSLDDGATWSTYSTSESEIGRWVYWRLEYTPAESGPYRLKARSVNDRGEVSPIAAVHEFEVV